MEKKTSIEKLRVLLPHRVEHNHQHGEEFRGWAAQVRKEGHPDLAELLEQAIGSMATTDGILEQALSSIGGPDASHHHHHHHHHHHD
ncbi:MAG: hypothetical protein AB1545_15960 [Thermodesulfobacteriota bacterium]